jgi:CRISPR-associated protein Csm4
MSLFRVRIALRAPLGTPLTSGTLFGHLCWARRESAGEQALIAWLKGLPDAPWALSDGFPAGLLPRPLVRPAPRHATGSGNMTAEALKRLEEDKQRAKWPWLPIDRWEHLRGRVSDPLLQACATSDPALSHRLVHNSIDRRTGSTPEEGGLYFVDEDWSHATVPERDVYVRAKTTADELQALFEAVGEAGYGRDATWGRGQFTIVTVSDADSLDQHDGNRMLSLSHGCLTTNMATPRYKLFTHFGKVGADLPTNVPWKSPILLTGPGATFAPADGGPFGAWLTGIHQERAEVGHNAYHVAIPFTEVAAGKPQ